MVLPIYVMPDVVKLLVGFYREQYEMTALLPATQIRGQSGDDPTFPLVRITRISDTAFVAEPPILDQVVVQIDCWGGNNRQAERIAATAKATLAMRGPGYGNDEGWITKVVTQGMGNLPDEDYEPVRERYVLQMAVWVQPLTPRIPPPYIPKVTITNTPDLEAPNGDVWVSPSTARISLRVDDTWVQIGSNFSNLVNHAIDFASTVPVYNTSFNSLLVPSAGDPRVYECWWWNGAWEQDADTPTVPVPGGTPVWPDGAIV